MFKIDSDGTPTLEIKIKSLDDGVCSRCEGSGIVIPKDGEKRLVDAGSFCGDCDEGRGRWRRVIETISIAEKVLHAPPHYPR